MTLILNGTDNSATTPAVTGTDTDTGVFFPTANVVAFSTSGSEDARFDATGNFGVGTTTPSSYGKIASVGTNTSSALLAVRDEGTATGNLFIVSSNSAGTIARINSYGIGVGGATPSSGMGITFPATQSASSDANTLDDYEEGTWTPTIKGSVTAGTSTYSTQTGKYVKVGNIVFITVYVTWNSASGTGNLRIASLPFAGASGVYQGLAISGISSVSGSTSGYVWFGRINSGESEISVKWANFATTTPNDGDIAVCNSGTLLFTGTYTV